METNELVKQAKDGDAEAFGLIYDSFAQRIFKYIRLKVQNREQAEDILQDVFVKAYRGLPGLSLDNLNFSAWLYKIAGNTINDFFRKKYRTPEIMGLDETFDVADKVSLQHEVEVKSEMEGVQEVLHELPPLYRQVLELRFIQEFSLDETAKVLNKSNLAIRLIQFRALKKVRVIFKKSDDQRKRKI